MAIEAPRKKHGYIPELDGMRAVAIGAVLLYHCWGYLGEAPVGRAVSSLAAIGWAGVDIFFAISGFLITGILLSAREQANYYKRFFIRRSIRIFPLYYLVTTLVLIAGLAIRYLELPVSDPSLDHLDRIWINYLYLVNFAVAFFDNDTVLLSIAWSLAIEEQYYLIFPFIVLHLSRRNLMRVLVGACLLAPVFRVLIFSWTNLYDTAYVLPFCRMDNLAVGGIALMLYQDSDSIVGAAVARAAPLLWLIALFFLFTWTREDLVFISVGYFMVAAATAATILAITKGRLRHLSKVLRWRWLMYIGQISYGLYLIHLLVRTAIDIGPLKSTFAAVETDLTAATIRLFFCLIASIAVAAFSWKFFERPLLALKDRFAPTTPSGGE